MIKLLSICIMMMGLAVCHAQQPAFLKTFEPNSNTFDFGDVKEKKGKVSHVFKFINRGSKLVSISKVNTWCGCMVADYTKNAIRQGETAIVKVDLDPSNLHGKVIKQVVLLLNGGNYYSRLWIKANVVPYQRPIRDSYPYDLGSGLFVNLQTIPFPESEVGCKRTVDLKLANNTSRPMIIEFRREPNNTMLEMPRVIKLKPREHTSIQMSYTYFRKYKVTRYIRIYPIINGKNGKPLIVRWNVNDKFRLLND